MTWCHVVLGGSSRLGCLEERLRGSWLLHSYTTGGCVGKRLSQRHVGLLKIGGKAIRLGMMECFEIMWSGGGYGSCKVGVFGPWVQGLLLRGIAWSIPYIRCPFCLARWREIARHSHFLMLRNGSQYKCMLFVISLGSSSNFWRGARTIVGSTFPLLKSFKLCMIRVE